MMRSKCPHCFRPIGRFRPVGRAMAFQCMGRGSPGKAGCKPAIDEVRARETGFTAPALPVFMPAGWRSLWPGLQTECPDCGGLTPRRACPHCHTPLPAELGTGPSPLIAFVGAKGTGKTVYMTVLAYEVGAHAGPRFRADVHMVLGRRQVEIEQIVEKGDLFEQTAESVEGRRAPAVLEWRRPARGPMSLLPRHQLSTTYLSFFDTSGEEVSDPDKLRRMRYLTTADAFVVLLDPFLLPAVSEQLRLPPEAIRSEKPDMTVLRDFTDMLRTDLGSRGKKITLPVAVVFPKIDALFGMLGDDSPIRHPPAAQGAYDETAGERTHEHVRALLRRWDALDIDLHLENNYETYRYFVVSALGAEPDYTRDYDKSPVDPRGVRPFRVDEPLLWLMSHFGIVTSTRRRA